MVETIVKYGVLGLLSILTGLTFYLIKKPKEGRTMSTVVLAEKEVDRRADVYDVLIDLLHEAKMDYVVKPGEEGKKLVQLVEYQE